MGLFAGAGRCAEGLVFPRTLHWITGPSRSGDIEMTMLFGAHGPLSLTIFIQDDR
ncbi:MAG: hypothetical protein EBU29_08540 [Gammaproteobacteria bacterium]|nr:hypothetical protein [Gammaproteobacteria bacterium]